MKHFAALLLALASLPACAAHNSHRVNGEPLEHWWPLVDEALGETQAVWGRELPSTDMHVAVGVERVEVQWVPPPVPTGELVEPVHQAELGPLLVDALQKTLPLPGRSAPAGYVMQIELETDLHAPDAIGMRVSCTLVENREGGHVLARGTSGCMRLARLYCHGCRDRWGGEGSSLGTHAVVAGGAYVGVGGTWCYGYGGGSSGYIKVD